MASLWEGEGRGGKPVKSLQIVLWTDQSVFWHSGEQYAAERHDEQSLASEALHVAHL